MFPSVLWHVKTASAPGHTFVLQWPDPPTAPHMFVLRSLPELDLVLKARLAISMIPAEEFAPKDGRMADGPF